MEKRCLEQLIEVSHAVGNNPQYVQAAGGNTSVKSPDGRTMAIKASGTPLTAMSESDGWVELDVAAVLRIFDREDLASLPSKEREAQVLEHLRQSAVGGNGRPSVESALHALLGRVVVHTHAVAANALNCGPGEAALKQSLRGQANCLRCGFPIPIRDGAWRTRWLPRRKHIAPGMGIPPRLFSWRITAC